MDRTLEFPDELDIAIWAIGAIGKFKLPSNCQIWAVKQWLTKGGSLRWEWTKYNKLPWLRWRHVWWVAPDGAEYEYTTKGPKEERYLPPPLFFGVVKKRK